MTNAETGVEITVDGAAVAALPGEWLITACERSGIYIPRFCYHPRMKSVGMCRMCLVEVDTGRGPALQPSCMVPVAPGMAVFTESEAAKKAQDGVLEFLLINHPLDCPVCDKGGECPLQDQTMAYGPGETRFVEEKRHFSKPIAISETVYLDRERCILCDRCTRFADEVAGDALIHFMGRGNQTEVNTFPDEPFASYFSGNTVQICPVGALTAVPYRFKARPWDLTETLSVAWVDSVGARVAVQASRNRVLRVLGADSDAVNWGWLSDKERFGFEALNSADRLGAPMLRDAASEEGPALREAGWGEALSRVSDALAGAAPERVAVLGGARLTNEAQYAWAKLAKAVIGTDNVDCQLGDGLDPRLVLGLPRATIDDVCRPGGTVLLIGPDPKEELGTLYLRLRHAVVNDGVELIEISPCSTGLSSLARHSLRPRPGATARLLWYLLYRWCSRRGSLSVLDMATRIDVENRYSDSSLKAAVGVGAATVDAVAEELEAAGAGVTVVWGQSSSAESVAEVGEVMLAMASLNWQAAVKQSQDGGDAALDGVSADAASPDVACPVTFLPALRRGNLRGALEAGLAPGLLPGAWPLDRVPAVPGLDAEGILTAAADGDIDVLVLLGCDPLNDFVDRGLAVRGLQGAGLVVAVDLFVNDSAALVADVVLAAAGPTECDGTFTNFEGRVGLMSRKVTPPGTARPDWMIAAELAERLAPGSASSLDSPEAIRAELASVSPAHGALSEEALAANPLEGVLLASPLPLAPTLVFPAEPSLPPDDPFAAASVPVAADSDPVAADSDPVAAASVPLSAASRDLRVRCEELFEEVSREWGDCEHEEHQDARKWGRQLLFRLVASRTMYDDGVMLRHCPSLRGLAGPARARVNPADLRRITAALTRGRCMIAVPSDDEPTQITQIRPEDDHPVRAMHGPSDDEPTQLLLRGPASGDTVRVSSGRGHIEAVLLADAGVPEGVLAVDWLPTGAPANTLLTAGEAVTVVMVEPA